MVILLSSFVRSQHFIEAADSGKFSIQIHGAGMYGSNQISNDARRAFFGNAKENFSWQEEIDSWKRLPRFGAYGIGNLQFNVPLEHASFSHLIFKASSWNFLGLNTNQNMSRLLTIGNYAYRGDSLDLGGSSINSFSAYGIGAGIIIRNKLEISASYQFLPSYVEGELLAPHFYTSDFGDSIAIEAGGFLSINDTSRLLNNHGVSLDLVYHTHIMNANGSKAPLSLYIRNLGAAYIQSNSRYYFDTSYSYTGIEYNIPADIGSEISVPALAESLGLQKNSKPYWRYLPFRVGVHKGVVDSSELKLRSYYGLDLIFSRSFMPLVYFGGQYQLTEELSLLGQVSSGDVSLIKPGLGLKYTSDKLNLILFSNNFIGEFSPLSYGNDIRLSLNYNF
jgi:hypothetical protein